MLQPSPAAATQVPCFQAPHPCYILDGVPDLADDSCLFPKNAIVLLTPDYQTVSITID
jgi:hypothetical protein